MEEINSIALLQCIRISRPQLRKTSDLIIFLPEWGSLNPIYYTSNKNYGQVHAQEFSLKDIALLTKYDCAWIFKYELSRFTDDIDDISTDTCIYLPNGEQHIVRQNQELSVLKKLIKECEHSKDPVQLQLVTDEYKINVITTHPALDEWVPLCKVENHYYLCLEPGFQVRNI